MWFVLSVMNIVVCWRFKNGVTDDCIWSFHEVIIRINRKFINVHELVSYQFIINEILRWMIVKWPESQYSCKSILLSHNFTHLHTKSCKSRKNSTKFSMCRFAIFRLSVIRCLRILAHYWHRDRGEHTQLHQT